MIKKALLSVILTTVLCTPALAQDEVATKLDTPQYSPDYCEFTATFPEEPYITSRCENPDDPNTCFNLISYTKVFEPSASLRVEIICNPSTPAMYEQFQPETMEKTVTAMTQGSVIEAFELSTRQDDEYRQTGLVGKGRKGLDDTIYLAQLWIGQSSIMSVEAELSGIQMDESDKMFADILGSIGYTKQIEAEKNKQDATPEAPQPKEN